MTDVIRNAVSNCVQMGVCCGHRPLVPQRCSHVLCQHFCHTHAEKYVVMGKGAGGWAQVCAGLPVPTSAQRAPEQGLAESTGKAGAGGGPRYHIRSQPHTSLIRPQSVALSSLQQCCGPLPAHCKQ